MKLILLHSLAALILSAVFCAVAADAPTGSASRKLQHVVCFKFKDSASSDQIRQVEQAFRDLKKKIPQIISLEWGTNNSPEGKNRGMSHCFILTFNNEKDRDAYLPHPDHKAFGSLLRPILADVFVIDFWAQE